MLPEPWGPLHTDSSFDSVDKARPQHGRLCQQWFFAFDFEKIDFAVEILYWRIVRIVIEVCNL